jgi:hypothetical protein
MSNINCQRSGFNSELSSLAAPSGQGSLATPLPEPDKLPTDQKVVLSSRGMRPLTPREYDNTVEMIFRDTRKIGSKELSLIVGKYFDGNMELGTVSDELIRSYEIAAASIAIAFASDSARKAAVLPCQPSSISDRACFQRIATELGELVLRTPLTSQQITEFTNLMANAASTAASIDFAIEIFTRLVLQHPQFLYRWEVGEKQKTGPFALNNFEFASRLAFTLWGAGPDRTLLNAAKGGTLRNPVELDRQVDRMLADPKAVDLTTYFHGGWLGFNSAPLKPEIAADQRNETKQLIKRVLFDEGRPWSDLMTFDQTFLTSSLATFYGLPQPSSSGGGWVSYPDSSRRGILSHGTFLGVGGRGNGEVSTTFRGKNIRTNVFCEVIPPPPPNLNLDALPETGTTSGRCLEEVLQGHLLNPGMACINCHSQMDPIALGLSNFSGFGNFQVVETNKPECSIVGAGEAKGYGRFVGPGQLAELAVDSGRVQMCLVQRWLQFSAGTSNPDNSLKSLGYYLDQFNRDGNFKSLLKKYVTDPEFKQRVSAE